MLRPEQLELKFAPRAPTRSAGRDSELEVIGGALLRAAGAPALAALLRVEWNPRLRSAAGRAHYNERLISLNPRLHEHGPLEIERTLRHELAHLLAHSRAPRRRISPHGPEWRRACIDVEIPDETRCHTLPFPVQRRRARFLYRCPKCGREFPRVRLIRRRLACLACCRTYHGGNFSRAAQLELVRTADQV